MYGIYDWDLVCELWSINMLANFIEFLPNNAYYLFVLGIYFWCKQLYILKKVYINIVYKPVHLLLS
jgi:hypothetical protein